MSITNRFYASGTLNLFCNERIGAVFIDCHSLHFLATTLTSAFEAGGRIRFTKYNLRYMS